MKYTIYLYGSLLKSMEAFKSFFLPSEANEGMRLHLDPTGFVSKVQIEAEFIRLSDGLASGLLQQYFILRATQ